MPEEKQQFHFFVSSVAEWRVSEDLFSLIRKMDREKCNYALWYVPVPKDAAYEIRQFAPQVEGAILLGLKKF